METLKSRDNKRVATYITHKIKYRRRKDLENDNGHMIVLDVGNHKLPYSLRSQGDEDIPRVTPLNTGELKV